MTPVIAFSTISELFSKHRNAIQKFECDVDAGATFPVYVQLIDWPTPADLAAGLTVPANGIVPVKSWPVPTGQNLDVYKEFKNGPLHFANGVFAAVSTTQATLTIGTGNNKFDSVAAELLDKDVVNTEVSGQAVFSLTGLSDANGLAAAHYLLRMAARNLNTGYSAYLQLFAQAQGTNGGTPLRVWQLAANTGGAAVLSQQVSPAGSLYPSGTSAAAALVGDTVYADFGAAPEGLGTGLFVRSQDSSLANHQGIYFYLSTTETTLTLDTGSGMNIYIERT